MAAPDTPGGKVLVVDDDEAIRVLLTRYLEMEGFSVEQVRDGGAALAAIAASQPDLVLLDLMLPSQDGLDILTRLRRDSDVPVILLTARGAEADRILGLKLGADDYVVKPFSPGELAARISSVLRRARPSSAQSVLQFDGLALDLGTREVTVDDQVVSTTAREFELLAFLAASPPAGLLPPATAYQRLGLLGGVAGPRYRHRARPPHPPADRGRPRAPALDQDGARRGLPLQPLIRPPAPRRVRSGCRAG